MLLGFLKGEQARLHGRTSFDERRSAVLACFTRFFGPRGASTLDYVERSWAEEKNTRGCYAGFFGPGVLTSLGFGLRRPCGRIHWAGTETATVWTGYMDGAVQSGQRAAGEVLADL